MAPAPVVVVAVVPERAVLPALIALLLGVTAPALPPVEPGVESVIALVPPPALLEPATDPVAPTLVPPLPVRVLIEPEPIVEEDAEEPRALLAPELPEIGA